jgi:hypothetical protein
MPQNAPHVAVTVNIAVRPRSGDLILVNAGLAKPILSNLVYSVVASDGFYAFFCSAQCSAIRQADSGLNEACDRMVYVAGWKLVWVINGSDSAIR